jgi:hypothetical protein
MPVTLAQLNQRRRPRAVLWPSFAVFVNDFTIFALGCAGSYSVNVVGSLPGNEVLSLILLPFLLINHRKRAFRREYLWFYVLLLGWLFGTIVGDLYLGVSLDNKLKGIARVVFFGMDFVILAILINKKTRGMIVFALSVAVSFAVSSLGFASSFFTEWKYGLGYGLTIVASLVSCHFYRRRRYSICVAVSLGLAGLDLFFAYRSQMAINLMAVVIMLPIVGMSKGQAGRGFDGTAYLKLMVVLLLTGGAAYGANQVVKYAVSQNFFNEEIEAKFQAQSEGQLGVLVGGRPETLVAIQAIEDSPIIGHGSFAVDPKYLQILQDIQYKYGYSDSDESLESDVPAIPTHSHLTQAWVESGILGGIFWIYIIALVLRGILQLVRSRPAMTPLYCVVLISFVWDILYSPMGSVNRMIGDFYILMSYDLLQPMAAQARAPRRLRARPFYVKTAVRLSGSRS